VTAEWPRVEPMTSQLM